MADDSYKTIKQVAEGYYTEKRSRFISYAVFCLKKRLEQNGREQRKRLYEANRTEDGH